MNKDQEYKELIIEYKKLKQQRESYLEELAEKKGNLTAYEAEKEEQIKKAKELKVDPKSLKQEIEKMTDSIKKRLEENKKICEELENNQIG